MSASSSIVESLRTITPAFAGSASPESTNAIMRTAKGSVVSGRTLIEWSVVSLTTECVATNEAGGSPADARASKLKQAKTSAGRMIFLISFKTSSTITTVHFSLSRAKIDTYFKNAIFNL